MTTSVNILILFDRDNTTAPPGTEFIVTESGDNIITEDGKDIITE